MLSLDARPVRTFLPLALTLALVGAAPAASFAAPRTADAATSADDSSTDTPVDETSADIPDDGLVGDDCTMQSRAVIDDPDLDAVPDPSDLVSCGDDKPAPPVALGSVLKKSSFDGGTLKLSGAGTVDQVLTFKGKVLGSVHKKVGKAGQVRLTIKLSKSAKAKLKRTKGTIKLTLTTTSKVSGFDAHKTSRTITLKAG